MMKMKRPSERRSDENYQELKLLHSAPLLWDANYTDSDDTAPLVATVDWLRQLAPNPYKVDMAHCFAIVLRASRIRYGTVVPGIDVISAYLDPSYKEGEDFDFASNRALSLIEFALALEMTRGSGGLIGLDPDRECRGYLDQEEPDDILMGIA